MNVTAVLKNQFDKNQGNKRRNIMLWNEIITQEDVKKIINFGRKAKKNVLG